MDRDANSSAPEPALPHRDQKTGGELVTSGARGETVKSDPSYERDWMCESLPFSAAEW